MMKKLLLITSGALLLFASCYKEKLALSAKDALVATVWKIDKHMYGSVEPGANCGVAQELVFKSDSTGYYYYPTPCDSGDYDTLRFHWVVSVDNRNLYLSKINGKVGANETMGISYYDATNLQLRGNSYFKRYLSGYFIAKPE